MAIFEYISYGEFTRLVVCLTLDMVEYIIPYLLTPFVGDIFDVVGLVMCVLMFGWSGLFALLELVPGLDPFPVNVLTWVIWLFRRRWRDIAFPMR